MEIRGDELAGLMRGVVTTKEVEGRVRPIRLTEAQIAHYEAENDAWGIRAHCTAGVTLAFVTDATKVELVVHLTAGARTYGGIDVEVDGALITSALFEKLDGEVRVPLFGASTARERQVRVHLPQSAVAEVEALVVEDGSTVKDLPMRPKRLLSIGDSITQGMDARSPSLTYAVQVAKGLDAELHNLGVGGHIYDPASIDGTIDFKPDLVTVAYGTNDWNKELTAEEIGAVVTEYLAKLKGIYADTRIVVVSPLWRSIWAEEKKGGTLHAFAASILEAAKGVGCETVDGWPLVPHQERFYADGTHPNDEGFMHYAMNLATALR